MIRNFHPGAAFLAVRSPAPAALAAPVSEYSAVSICYRASGGHAGNCKP